MRILRSVDQRLRDLVCRFIGHRRTHFMGQPRCTRCGHVPVEDW